MEDKKMIDKKLIDDFLKVAGSEGDITQLLDQSNKGHIINSTALFLALVDKGIITNEEISNYKMLATHAIDQEWTKRVDQEDAKAKEVLKKIDDACPGFMNALGCLKKDDSGE